MRRVRQLNEPSESRPLKLLDAPENFLKRLAVIMATEMEQEMAAVRLRGIKLNLAEDEFMPPA